MKKKNLISAALIALTAIQCVTASAYDTTDSTLYNNAQEFAMRYEYHEGDSDISFDLYDDIPYTSGIETTEDGKTYEVPAFYYDKDASFLGCYDLQKGEMNLILNGQASEYGVCCVLYNGVTLLPANVFEVLGCTVSFDEDLYITEISNGETTLELLPQLIGMRKNKENGYYVPLAVCARFIDDVVYIPARAVANELGISIDWDGTSNTVIMSSNI